VTKRFALLKQLFIANKLNSNVPDAVGVPVMYPTPEPGVNEIDKPGGDP
jgi:hypothetical protein